MVTVENIHNSVIVYNFDDFVTRDYNNYILCLLKTVVKNKNLYVNVIIGNYSHEFKNNNNTYKIHINYEHTLVKGTGRSLNNDSVKGTINYDENKTYLVRINELERYNKNDFIIDYSIPNIHNIHESKYKIYTKKMIYIAPYIYDDIYKIMSNRNIQSLTTFINTNEPRRKQLLSNLSNRNVKHTNVNNCFDKYKLQDLYKQTRVLINIHQTDHHHTFEELRCLPALQNGVIVVSEKSPLNNLIPYNDLIIWTDYENVIDKVKDVLDNYETYHNLIFTEQNVRILKGLDMKNAKVLEDKINASITEITEPSLEKLAVKYGLDKSIHTGCHNYIPAYTKLFENVRYSIGNLLEIGIGSVENNQMGGKYGPIVSKFNYKTGNSLKCWSEYFPQTNIYGIDIYSHPSLNKDRIKTFVANQNSETDLKNLMNEINVELDIIIDDGSHQGEHQVFSFIHLNKFLSPRGIYVIEDVQPPNINGFKDLSIFPDDIKEYIQREFVVECFDTRNTIGRPDDFIIAFTKIT